MENGRKDDGLINKNNATQNPMNEGASGITAKGAFLLNQTTTRAGKKQGLEGIDLVCFCHLRWNFVYQRPQHLLTRFSKKQRVFFIEEPIFTDTEKAYLSENSCHSGIHIYVPHLPHGLNEQKKNQILKTLTDELFESRGIQNFIAWYYTPMFLPFTNHLKPVITVYDCMDELSMFKFAPEKLLSYEEELFRKSDVVFTGGMNLYEYKKNKHHNIHGIPSSIDREHFSACNNKEEPEDQKNIPHPRIGFYGVLDERLDIELVSAVAEQLPDWSIVLIGPVVKIDPATLPRKSNIHYLGGKSYNDLPCYIHGWDVAMLPFAINESTRFISPTKTPEYLAAGKPVVSTPITDVVNPYGSLGIVNIAQNAMQFSELVRVAHTQSQDKEWQKKTESFLSQNSWDKTWQKMNDILCRALTNKNNGDDFETSEEELENIENQELEKVLAVVDKTQADQPAGNPIEKVLGKQTWDKIRNIFVNNKEPEAGSGDPVIRKITVKNNGAGSLMFDYLIVGAGFAGSVLAERLARELNKKVLIIDKRNHIAGNAFDHYNEDGILVHKYGPHIFHTNSRDVFDYLSMFTRWRNYEHRVLASVDGLLVPIPINLDTINLLYGFRFNAFELESYFESVAEKRAQILTSEDVVISKVGKDLYEKFFKGYTNKQWGLDPSQLNASVTSRVPTRTNRDDRYFTDKYQAMPLHGYTQMFSKMLDHPNIKIMLNTDYRDIIKLIPHREMIFTGPIDEFFDYRYGKLPYRSLEFVFETHDMPVFQKVGTINFPNEHQFTRITEFKYLSGQQHPKTSVVYEYPKAEGDPYYPVPRKENNDLYSRYEKLARETRPEVHFAGRLATYKYYNMDQVVAQSLSVFKKIKMSLEIQPDLKDAGAIRQNA